MPRDGAYLQDWLNEAQPVAYHVRVRLMLLTGQTEPSIGVLLLSVRKGSGTLCGTPLSRSAKVYRVSSFFKKLKMLRQLFTFRFLPYLLASHAIFSLFPNDELLLDGARTFAGDSKFKDDIGPAA